jgi:hypothetical protein
LVSTDLVSLLRGQLEQHVQTSKAYVDNLDKYLRRSSYDVECLRKESRESAASQRHDLEQLQKNFVQAQAFADKGQADLSNMIARQGRTQEELAATVLDLRDAVQMNKRELTNAVDIISKIDCLASSMDKDEVKYLKDELLKVSARVAKMETNVKTLLAKLAKCVEEKSAAKIREEPNQQNLEKLTNLQQEVEILKKEKEDLAREVKHLKHARKQEKIGNDNLEKRVVGLEASAQMAGDNFKKMQVPSKKRIVKQ